MENSEKIRENGEKELLEKQRRCSIQNVGFSKRIHRKKGFLIILFNRMKKAYTTVQKKLTHVDK
jgi:hypothetical protein